MAYPCSVTSSWENSRGRPAAISVCEELELDVVRPIDVLLQEDLAVPERGESLPSGHLHLAEQLLVVADHVQPASASAHGGFDHQGIACPRSEAQRLRRMGDTLLG